VKRVVLYHWKADDAKPLIQLMEGTGFAVHYDEKGTKLGKLREIQPVAVVIDLTRMPSQGRYVAAGIRSTKSIRHIPIVFVDGDPEKIAKIREMLPDATYTQSGKLAAALKRVKPAVEPVVIERLASFEPRTTAQKLGIREGIQVAVFEPPSGYLKILGVMPEGVELIEESEEVLPVTLWFVSDPDVYLTSLRSMRSRAAKTRLWVIYPKGNKTELTQFVVRDGALGVGLVDYKICSVNEVWTAMAFAIKK
jgi:hypothetical protein